MDLEMAEVRLGETLLEIALEHDKKCDNETAHVDADDAILQYLRDIGHGNAAEAYCALRDRIGFYYI